MTTRSRLPTHGYVYGGTLYVMLDERYPPIYEAAARAGTLQPIDYTNQNPSYATGAGSAISTADNLATWIRSSRRKRLQCRVPEPVAAEPATRGPEQTRLAAIRVRHLLPAFRPERLDVLPRWRNAGLQLVRRDTTEITT